MGSCCNGNQNDKDLINDVDLAKNKNKGNKNKDKDNKIIPIDNDDIDNQMRQNTNMEINNINENINNNNIFIANIKLKLTIKQSKSLQEGKEYIINSLGLLINNKNKTNDGLTIFGDENANTRTDFIFPKEESNTNQNHAEIKYDKTLDLFKIKSLRGNGCFLKIEQKILLKDEDIFSFSFFMLRVRIDIKSEEINNINTVIASLLTLEVLFGEEKKRKITFDSRKNSVIRIGRLKSDEIEFEFEDEDVSRKQCMIFFEDNNWYIVDGDGIKPSSNGTWFYPEKYYNINEGLIIRIGTTLFECNYI